MNLLKLFGNQDKLMRDKRIKSQIKETEKMTDEEFIQDYVYRLRLLYSMFPKEACKLCNSGMALSEEQINKVRISMLEKCGCLKDGKCKKGHIVNIESKKVK